MAIALEKRLRKIEKAVAGQDDEAYHVAWREMAERIRKRPESWPVLRAYWEQRFRARWAEERKRIEAVTRPEQLAELRKEWTKQDAQSKAREEEYLRKANIAAEDAESVLRRMIERT